MFNALEYLEIDFLYDKKGEKCEIRVKNNCTNWLEKVEIDKEGCNRIRGWRTLWKLLDRSNIEHEDRVLQ